MTTLRSTTTHAKAAPGFKRLPLAQGIALVVAAGLGAHASAESRILEEVVVTATKRSESVQDVPLAITALSGQFARAVNLNDVKDLVSFTPGVSGNSQDSFIDAISVRGVRTQDFGVGGDPSAAFFKNDLYEGRNGSAVTSLFDMDRAEILRGPKASCLGVTPLAAPSVSIPTRLRLTTRSTVIWTWMSARIITPPLKVR